MNFRYRHFESTHGRETEEPILHVKGWVNSRIEIAVLKSHSRMLYRARVPIPPTPPQLTDRHYRPHGYVSRQGLQGTNLAIWRGLRRFWCVMTSIRRKNHVFGQETKIRKTHIYYDPVEFFIT